MEKNPLQEKLLEMLEWLTGFCEKNELCYYVIGGTMLGAIRHKGFIPWDDDIDIAMPRDDYEKLLILLEKPLEHYVVESPRGEADDFKYNFAKFYDINTTLVELTKIPIKRGVYIDIFPLDGIGNTMEESYRNYRKIEILNNLFAMKVCKTRIGRVWWKNFATIIGSFVPINTKKLIRKLDDIYSEKKYYDCEYVGDLMSRIGRRGIIRREVYGTPKKYEFESLSVYGPEKGEEYLTHIYGDWKKLPPIEKQKSDHEFVEIDLNKAYM